jgi:hypothetical protein
MPARTSSTPQTNSAHPHIEHIPEQLQQQLPSFLTAI